MLLPSSESPAQTAGSPATTRARGPAPVVWLASYPRSGNTMLRTIMYQCFGIGSASVYPSDLAGNTAVEQRVGHIEHGPNGELDFTGQAFRLIKTHGRPQDGHRAIYVLRNGRDATLSFYRFVKGRVPLLDIIEGRSGQRTWTWHIEQWDPLNRPDTLFLRYEDMVADLSGTIDTIAGYLGAEPMARTLPDREALADNHWIVSAKLEKPSFDAAAEAAFQRVNGEQMARFGYL